MSRIEDGGAVEAGLNLERLANSGYTPGPWQWVTSHDYGYSALWNPDTRAEVISTSGRNDRDHPITWMGEEMSEADAELISSAVGLLDLATQQAAEITRLRAENAGMREALKPFALERSTLDLSRFDDENQVEVRYPPVGRHQRIPVGRVTIGDLRRARAALSKASQAEGQTR